MQDVKEVGRKAQTAKTSIAGVLIGLLVCGLIATVLVVYGVPHSISARSEELRCKTRLRRLGLAVNQWVIDHGHERFPPIVNPPQGGEWEPQRADSADQVLQAYLQGDVPRPQRQDESPQAHRLRMRSGAWTICPLTDLPFWYNPRLSEMRPADLVAGDPASVVYFHSQRRGDGIWPIETDAGVPAVHGVVGYAVHSTVTAADLENLRQQVQELDLKAGNSPDLGFWRRKLQQYEAAQRRAGNADGSFRMSALEAEVQVLPRGD